MDAKQMLMCYGKYWVDRTSFEKMYSQTIVMNDFEPMTFKYLPFLEESTLLTPEAYCIFEQCIAIEKGWA